LLKRVDPPTRIPSELLPLSEDWIDSVRAYNADYLGFVNSNWLMNTLITKVKTTRILQFIIKKSKTQKDELADYLRNTRKIKENIIYIVFQNTWTRAQKVARVQLLLLHLVTNHEAQSILIDFRKDFRKYGDNVNLNIIQVLMDITYSIHEVDILLDLKDVCEMLLLNIQIRWAHRTPAMLNNDKHQYTALLASITVWLLNRVLRNNLWVGRMTNQQARYVLNLLGRLLVSNVNQQTLSSLSNQEIDWSNYARIGSDVLFQCMESAIENYNTSAVQKLCELGFYVSADKFAVFCKKHRPNATLFLDVHSYLRRPYFQIIDMAMWYFPNMLTSGLFAQDGELYNYIQTLQGMGDDVVGLPSWQHFESWQTFTNLANEASLVDMTRFGLERYGTIQENYPFLVVQQIVRKDVQVDLRNAIMSIRQLPDFLVQETKPEDDTIATQQRLLQSFPRIRFIEIMHEWLSYRKQYLAERKSEYEREQEVIAKRREELRIYREGRDFSGGTL
jgi:hypothetical protein